jgi:hypothetical protein
MPRTLILLVFFSSLSVSGKCQGARRGRLFIATRLVVRYDADDLVRKVRLGNSEVVGKRLRCVVNRYYTSLLIKIVKIVIRIVNCVAVCVCG